MPVSEQIVFVNQLLAGLPQVTRKAILTRCEMIDLQINTMIWERGEV